ncbi:hypothetical protein [Sphingomonas sp. S2-65]|uniref:hypothetical protein n=1 Tax=Sphingomonas sp. S2-65 TaxID=2903960 RepID=UPI001F37BB06|nr:hypothetical protein [Sphingomonas sp. S2-65]UYY57540.1 hypothetical protein LZ586_12810 [Sphingomonas sp. S2-65]
MTGSDLLRMAANGAELHRGAARAQIPAIEALLGYLPQDRAGVRICDSAALATLALDGGIGAVARRHLGPPARPVRAILFDKNADVNWGLAWHQDRTVAVRRRNEVPDFGPWAIRRD